MPRMPSGKTAASSRARTGWWPSPLEQLIGLARAAGARAEAVLAARAGPTSGSRRRAARGCARSPRRSRRLGHRAGDPRHHARGEALERRDGAVRIEVMAMGRVDVVAQPHARVGDVDGAVGRAEPRRDVARERRGGLRLDARLQRRAAWRGASSHGAASAWSWLPGTRTTSPPAAPARAPIASSTGWAAASASRAGPWRSSSVSPSRTRRSTPSSSASSALARLRVVAQHVDARAPAEVQVGDDERAHAAARLAGLGDGMPCGSERVRSRQPAALRTAAASRRLEITRSISP